jgi:hypothetical protein
LAEDRSIVLVGGQAVAFWTRFLQERSPELAAMAPLGSKDIDFEGSARSVRRAAELLGGRMRLASIDDNTPNTGLVRFMDASGVEREIDFIDQPLGLTAKDVRDTAVQVILSVEADKEAKVWAMHPERCMESRIYNAQVLGKTDPIAIRQLKASIACAREWSRYMLDEEPSAERARAVLRVNERVFRRCAADIHFKAVATNLGIDPFEAVLVDHEALPTCFRETRYPQMQTRLNAVRENLVPPAHRAELSEDWQQSPAKDRAREVLEAYERGEANDSPELEHDLDIDR